MVEVNWQKLAQIKELKDYFEADFTGFKQHIEDYIQEWNQISAEDLDKLSLLRALEVTNGCTQWAHRRGDQESLPLEQTRACMKLSMSSIKNKQIDLKNGESITFSPEMEALIEEGRAIYIDAFKNNIPDQDKEFYALSTAQFMVYGKERMNQSFQLIRDNYEELFTDFYLRKGVNYVKPYLDAII